MFGSVLELLYAPESPARAEDDQEHERAQEPGSPGRDRAERHRLARPGQVRRGVVGRPLGSGGRRLADGTLEDPGAVVLVVPLRLTVDRGETRGSRRRVAVLLRDRHRLVPGRGGREERGRRRGGLAPPAVGRRRVSLPGREARARTPAVPSAPGVRGERRLARGVGREGACGCVVRVTRRSGGTAPAAGSRGRPAGAAGREETPAPSADRRHAGADSPCGGPGYGCCCGPVRGRKPRLRGRRRRRLPGDPGRRLPGIAGRARPGTARPDTARPDTEGRGAVSACSSGTSRVRPAVSLCPAPSSLPVFAHAARAAACGAAAARWRARARRARRK